MEGRHGVIVAPDDCFIEFRDGIPGFADQTSWVVVASGENPISWLQSTDTPTIALPVVIPWAFHWDYEIKVSNDDLAAIELDDVRDSEILAVVNVRTDISKGTINLFSPIIINRRLMLGRQVVNHLPGCSTRDPLVSGMHPVSVGGWDFPVAQSA